MRIVSLIPALGLSIAALAAPALATPVSSTVANLDDLQKQVADTERAFAATMARRDHAAFASFLAEDAIFLSRKTLRGKAAVAAGWKPLYERPDAPFSWAPERVEVLDDGKLAISTGPVWDPSGKKTGTFTSVWRQEAPGTWRIIFDKGDEACDCKKP